MFAVGIAPTPEAKEVIEATVRELLDAIEPWAAEHTYLNFADSRRKAVTLFSSLSYHRLRRIKATRRPGEPDPQQPSDSRRSDVAPADTLVGWTRGDSTTP